MLVWLRASWAQVLVVAAGKAGAGASGIEVDAIAQGDGDPGAFVGDGAWGTPLILLVLVLILVVRRAPRGIDVGSAGPRTFKEAGHGLHNG